MAISIAQWVTKLKRYRDSLRAARLRALEQAGKDIIPHLQRRTMHSGAVVTRQFLDGWFVVRRGDLVAIGNRAPHAPFVEYGRRPGRMPPIASIRRWVELKFNVGGQRAERMAWAIARKISLQGVKGREIIKKELWRLKLLIAKHTVKEVVKEWKRS